MFAYAHAKWCVLRVVSNAYTTDSRQHTRLGRPKRQPANSTAEEENLRRNQRPLARRPLRSWAAQHETSVRRTSRKRPRPSRAPQEVTRKTLRRAQTGREQRAAEQVDSRVLGSQGAARGRDARGGWMQGCMARGQHACGTLQSFVCCAGRQKGSGHCSGAREILMGGELSPATRRRPRGAHRGSAICIGENETPPAVPAVRIKLLARS